MFYRDITAAQGAALELDALMVVDPTHLLRPSGQEAIRPMLVQVEEKPRIKAEGVLDAYRSLGMYPGGHPFILLATRTTPQEAKNSLGGLRRSQLPPIVIGSALDQPLPVQLLDERYGELANLLKIFVLTSACAESVDVVERMLAWADLRKMPRLRFLLTLARPSSIQEFREELPGILRNLVEEVREIAQASEGGKALYNNAPPDLFLVVGITQAPRLIGRFWAPAISEFIARRKYKRVFLIHTGERRSVKTAMELKNKMLENVEGSQVLVCAYGPGPDERPGGTPLESYLKAFARAARDLGRDSTGAVDLAFIGELWKPLVLKVVEDLASKGRVSLEDSESELKVANLFCGVHKILCGEEGGEKILEHGFALERVWSSDEA